MKLIYSIIAKTKFSGSISSVFGSLSFLESFFVEGNFLEGLMSEAVCKLQSSKSGHLTADNGGPNN